MFDATLPLPYRNLYPILNSTLSTAPYPDPHPHPPHANPKPLLDPHSEPWESRPYFRRHAGRALASGGAAISVGRRLFRRSLQLGGEEEGRRGESVGADGGEDAGGVHGPRGWRGAC